MHPSNGSAPSPLALRLALAALVPAAAVVGQEPPHVAPALTVHEWGTFTCLMDDAGNTIGGVNTEDEPLPDFVHRPLRDSMIGGLLLGPGDLAPCFFQGAPACHPDVTMRLETPVLYFHLPAGAAPVTVDVEVAWRGGWLSEFYPRGDATLPGVDVGPVGTLDPEISGTLAWRGVRVGGSTRTAPPATDAPVWIAPRQVEAADVQVGDETERFLFYRGVGNAAPPLAIARDGDALVFRTRAGTVPGTTPESTGPGWLLHVDRVRGCAFRELPPLPLGAERPGGVLSRVRGGFEPDEFRAGNVETLRESMRFALVADGLFDDEARALLETWKVSYFQSPGLRVFYLMPRAWTDRVMPLRVSVEGGAEPDVVERVMVARFELIEAEQRRHLARIAAGPTSDGSWFHEYSARLASSDSARFAEVWGELNARPGALLEIDELEIPDDYRAWLALGRFRHALVLEELHRRPTDALRAFAGNYALVR